jgi:hypothetical protein
MGEMRAGHRWLNYTSEQAISAAAVERLFWRRTPPAPGFFLCLERECPADGRNGLRRRVTVVCTALFFACYGHVIGPAAVHQQDARFARSAPERPRARPALLCLGALKRQLAAGADQPYLVGFGAGLPCNPRPRMWESGLRARMSIIVIWIEMPRLDQAGQKQQRARKDGQCGRRWDGAGLGVGGGFWLPTLTRG